MFNVLLSSRRPKGPHPVGGAVVSMFAHGALLAALLLASPPAIRVATQFEQRIAEYLFPKDRAPRIGDESLDYLHVPGGGTGSAASGGGSGSATTHHVVAKPPDPLKLQVKKPDGGTEGMPDQVAQQQKMAESMGAFALLDVDSAAKRDPRSAAPAYPEDMEAKGIEGLVRVRFVVDSTGLVDLSTVKVLETTNESFARAVRTAMPDMRFRPAMMGATAVRQLSEQSFAFRVLRRDSSLVKKPR